MSFGIYAIGFAILIGGLIYGAYLVHMPTHWIVVGAVVLSLRRWDSDGCNGHTSERSCEITVGPSQALLCLLEVALPY